MITVYPSSNPGIDRTLWLLQELELPYQIKPTGDINLPLYKNTCCVADKDLFIATPSAIRHYLLHTYDRQGLRPPTGSSDYVLFTQWIALIEQNLLPLVQQQINLRKLGQARVPFFARSILKKAVETFINSQYAEPIAAQLEQIDNLLCSRAWIAGNYFTAADIELTYTLELLEGMLQLNDSYTYIQLFLQTVRERSAYQAAKEKNDTKTITLSMQQDENLGNA